VKILDIKEGRTPFRCQPDAVIKRVRGNGARGVGEPRMWELMTNGQISDAERIIIQILFELEYVTAGMIKQCHMNTLISPSYKWISADEKKNPYRRVLAQLEKLGVIVVLALFIDNQQVGVRIYSLSAGARAWMRSQYRNCAPIFLKGVDHYVKGDNETLDPTFELTEEVLGKLARNQFHIKAINARYADLSAYSPNRFVFGILEVAYYRTKQGWHMFLVPARRGKSGIIHLQGAIESLISSLREAGQENYSCVLIVAETLEHIKELNPELKKMPVLRDIPVFFITDIHTKNEESVFDHLIHYMKTGSSGEYETITIEF